MKRLFTVLLIIMLFSSAFADIEIPKLTNVVLKYNSVAKVLGTEEIDENTLVKIGDISAFTVSGCIIAFNMNESGEIVDAAVSARDNTDGGEFLRTCMTMMTLLGGMDYSAYGHLLHQYSQVASGKESGTFYICGIDTFNITAGSTGPMFSYSNNDLATWY